MTEADNSKPAARAVTRRTVADSKGRRPYRQPELVLYGSLVALTGTADGTAPDGGGGFFALSGFSGVISPPPPPPIS